MGKFRDVALRTYTRLSDKFSNRVSASGVIKTYLAGNTSGDNNDLGTLKRRIKLVRCVSLDLWMMSQRPARL